MRIIRFRSNEEHKDLLKKVKKMKKFTEELEECLEEAMEDDEYGYRGGSGSYRKDWDDEEEDVKGRYGYRRGGMR